MTKVPHFLIVEAPYYEDISTELRNGARATLEAAGATFECIAVPGAFEIPGAIRLAADGGRFDGYVALGCVIRGETTHYDYVCGESARGLMDLAVQDRLAIGFGIVTTENWDQAWERAAVARKNKGHDAAQAALRMVELRQQFLGP